MLVLWFDRCERLSTELLGQVCNSTTIPRSGSIFGDEKLRTKWSWSCAAKISSWLRRIWQIFADLSRTVYHDFKYQLPSKALSIQSLLGPDLLWANAEPFFTYLHMVVFIGTVIAKVDARVALRIVLKAVDDESVHRLLRVMIRDNASVEVIVSDSLSSLLVSLNLFCDV